MTPAGAFFASLSLILWVTWTIDTWPPRVPTASQIVGHVLRSVAWLLLCALGAAFWTVTIFRGSP